MRFHDAISAATELAYEEDADQIVGRIDGKWAISHIEDEGRKAQMVEPLFVVHSTGIDQGHIDRGELPKNRAAVSLGRRGGRVKSEAKTAAARENGKKGGRPRLTDRMHEALRWIEALRGEISRKQMDEKGALAGEIIGLDIMAEHAALLLKIPR